MELIDALRTTGAVREFTDEPVSDDALWRVLDNARFSPSGGNQQDGASSSSGIGRSGSGCVTSTCPVGTTTSP